MGCPVGVPLQETSNRGLPTGDHVQGNQYWGPPTKDPTADTLQGTSTGDQIACGDMSDEARRKLTYLLNQLVQGRKISSGNVFIPIGKIIMKSTM
jgi:hypothetical protein